MSVVAFDTLRFAKRLEEGGVPPGQAAATAAAFAEATGEMIATKLEMGDLRRDLAAVRAELKADLAAVRAEIEALRAEVKADIAAVRGEIEALRAEVKADIAAVRGEIEALRAEVKADLRELELRMTIKLGTLVVAGLAVAATLQKLL